MSDNKTIEEIIEVTGNQEAIELEEA